MNPRDAIAALTAAIDTLTKDLPDAAYTKRDLQTDDALEALPVLMPAAGGLLLGAGGTDRDRLAAFLASYRVPVLYQPADALTFDIQGTTLEIQFDTAGMFVGFALL